MNSELLRRVFFTLGALLVYRLGRHVPLPEVDADTVRLFLKGDGSLLQSSGIERVSLLALGVLPYVSAAVILQLASILIRRLYALSLQGVRGRKILSSMTLCLTAVLAILQGAGIAAALESVDRTGAAHGWLQNAATMLTLAAGALFVAWLSEQITLRGLGNGLALILCLDFVLEVPGAVADSLDLIRRGVVLGDHVLLVGAALVGLVVLIVFVERAWLRIPVTYDGGPEGRADQNAFLPFKINNAGLIPFLIAAWLAALPGQFFRFDVRVNAPAWGAFLEQLAPGRPLFLILTAVGTVLLALFYTAFLVDPDRLAGAMQTYGGRIVGVQPGQPTANYIDKAVSRITLGSAVYLAAVSAIPDIAFAKAGLPVYFAGTSLLVVVCTTLDLESQVQGMTA